MPLAKLRKQRTGVEDPANLYAPFYPHDFLITSTVPFPSYDELAMQMRFEPRQSTHSRCLRVIAPVVMPK